MADSFNTRRRRWCHKLATDKRLTPTQRLIGILLAEMTRPERQSCNPSRKWIAKQIGCKPGAVTRAVRKLKDHEYLTVPIKGNISAVTGEAWSNRYEFNWNIAQEFNLGSMTPRDQGAWSVGITENVSEDPAAYAAASGLVPPASATAFEYFISIVERYGKRGKYGTDEAILKKYNRALTLPGVTEELLARKYENDLEAAKGKNFSGDYVLRWFDNTGNYLPGIPGTKGGGRPTKTKASNAVSRPAPAQRERSDGATGPEATPKEPRLPHMPDSKARAYALERLPWTSEDLEKGIEDYLQEYEKEDWELGGAARAFCLDMTPEQRLHYSAAETSHEGFTNVSEVFDWLGDTTDDNYQHNISLTWQQIAEGLAH